MYNSKYSKHKGTHDNTMCLYFYFINLEHNTYHTKNIRFLSRLKNDNILHLNSVMHISQILIDISNFYLKL